MLRDQHVLAVIPARGGRTRLPGKNLAKVGPHSLVEWAVRVERAVEAIDNNVLSSDEDDFADEVLPGHLSIELFQPFPVPDNS